MLARALVEVTNEGLRPGLNARHVRLVGMCAGETDPTLGQLLNVDCWRKKIILKDNHYWS